MIKLPTSSRDMNFSILVVKLSDNMDEKDRISRVKEAQRFAHRYAEKFYSGDIDIMLRSQDPERLFVNMIESYGREKLNLSYL